MFDPSGAVSDEKVGVKALEEKAWMMKETVFSETIKQPLPSVSGSRAIPDVQELPVLELVSVTVVASAEVADSSGAAHELTPSARTPTRARIRIEYRKILEIAISLLHGGTTEPA